MSLVQDRSPPPVVQLPSNSVGTTFKRGTRPHSLRNMLGNLNNILIPDVVKCILLLKALLGLNVAP